MRTETIALRGRAEVKLTAYLLDASPELSNAALRPAVLVFPGGGYRGLSDREAEPVAMAYLAEGFQAFVLRYSVRTEFPEPLLDAEEALDVIRMRSAGWGVDPERIAAIGFSAGGHLAAALGTMGRVRPNALLLGYPCILSSMSEVLAVPIPSVDREIDERTPPAFLFAACDDTAAPVENTISFMRALDEKGIPFEAHIFQSGGHGLSLAKTHTSGGYRSNVNPRFAEWFALSVSWLREVLGDFSSDEDNSVPQARDAGRYGIDVAIGGMLARHECREAILELFPQLSDKKLAARASSYSLSIVNEALPVPHPDDRMRELDGKLRQIALK
ncbi:alpha/beta hydrolase [Cohnella sp. LGH]|uniref:alpha/beta hydrolase n=1 Tax=Cohnella sp. LGH TaxID=1619153 RepID=UPI001ADC8844|nr:alpha/beta hydrolase [Cohnella sp. LGH]QTH44519.1 alpha/beta hydrolase [Cohnella sp. LGH]